jgi:uncharacterized protein (TIGR03382 family)
MRAWLTVVLLWVTSSFGESAHAQVELTGTYVRYFAVGPQGRFFDGSTHTFQYTESGMAPFSCDFFYPGTTYEGFYVSATAAGVASERSNTETAIQISTLAAPVLTGRTITWRGQYVHASAPGAQIDIDQVVTYETADRAVRVDVTLRNSGTVALSDVYYGRRGEPDQGSCNIGTDYTTTNDVDRQPPGDSSGLVTAAAGAPPVVLGVGSFDSRVRMDVGGWPGAIATVWSAPRDPGATPSDTWIQWAFREPSLAVGGSTTFTFYYVFGTSAAQVAMRLDELSFPTAPCVGLAEGAMCTTAAGAPGLCRASVCCTGCFDGTRCVLGTTVPACGRAGAMCASCADTDACTSDLCTTGACVHPSAPTGTGCNDGSFCTLTDACDGMGRCVGGGPTCDDGESCTTDSCDEGADRCTNTARADGTACTSGSAGVCRVGSCCTGCWDGSLCQFGGTPAACGAGGGACASCTDTDSCTVDLCSAGACSNPRAPVGSLCDDGLFCTRTDGCDATGACVGGGTPRCADGMECTADSCDEERDMCVFMPVAGCTIGGECVATGTTLISNPCLVCDPARNMFDWSPQAEGTECGASECMVGRLARRTCSAAGMCVRSTMPCPTGECEDTMACVIPCMTAGCPDGEWCDPDTMACAPRIEDGEACDDGASCRSGFCTDGVCCESACDGVCESCDGASRGMCEAIGGGIDPDDECDTACDGMRACAGTDGGVPDAGSRSDGGPISVRDAGPTGPIDRDDGCGCAPSDPSGSLGIALLALVGLVLRRRR